MTTPPRAPHNQSHDPLDEDFYDFASLTDEASPELPAHMKTLRDRLSSELVSSRWRVVSLYLALSTAGYVLSLSLCAQNIKGLTPLSHMVEHWLHGLGPIGCGLICGLLFSGLPLGFSLALIGRFRRRYLIARDLWLVQSFTVLAALIVLLPVEWPWGQASEMALTYRDNTLRILTWSLAAILIPSVVTNTLRTVMLMGSNRIKNRGRSRNAP